MENKFVMLPPGTYEQALNRLPAAAIPPPFDDTRSAAYDMIRRLLQPADFRQVYA